MKNEIEIRTFKAELRADDGDKPKIKGTASVFNSLSEDLGGFREIIEPNSFGNTIINDDVFALKNHDENLVLGRNLSGTLSLIEDDIGLQFIVDPPNTTYANDLLVSMARKDMDKCSFAFTISEGGDWWEKVDNQDIRHITKFERLYDVSIVTYPAFRNTSAELFGMTIKYPEQVYREYRSLQSKTQQKQEPVTVNSNRLKMYESIMKGK